MSRVRWATGVVFVCLMLTACESTNVAPAAAPTARLEDDERRLWSRAKEEEVRLENSGFVATVPELEAYLTGVVAGLKPEPLPEGATFRVRVLIDPTLNAFALPDGRVYVHTGMLARLENEAQLAAVLGHEITHATHRHGVRAFRDLKNKTAFAAVFTASTAGVGGLLGAIGAASAISGYSQDLERDADTTGFRLMVNAGYDPRAGTTVFQLLLAESRRSKIREPFFFGSHPRLTERIASFQQLTSTLAPEKKVGRLDADLYQSRISDILLVNAEAAQQAGDLDFARECIDRRLKQQPDDTRAALMYAEVQRKRGADTDAVDRYQKLTQSHPDVAGAYRGLGLLLFKGHRFSEAAVAFHRFLELAPNAPDRSHIESFLQQCERTP